MKLEDCVQLAAILFALVLIIGGAIWWIPQKWEACGKLYDNLPAKIICLNSDGIRQGLSPRGRAGSRQAPIHSRSNRKPNALTRNVSPITIQSLPGACCCMLCAYSVHTGLPLESYLYDLRNSLPVR
jgi:hypothetical protein